MKGHDIVILLLGSSLAISIVINILWHNRMTQLAGAVKRLEREKISGLDITRLKNENTIGVHQHGRRRGTTQRHEGLSTDE